MPGARRVDDRAHYYSSLLDPLRSISNRAMASWALNNSDLRTGRGDAAGIVAVIETAVSALTMARDLVDRFHDMVRHRKPADLEPWIEAAKESPIASLANGIALDQTAVRAALIEPWSSGQVEAQIHKLKLVKRQMYGRANLDLLRARLIAAPS